MFVLVIDDNAEMREGLAEVLEQFGHRVVIAASAQDGLDATWRQRPDVILLDMQMPGMHGTELLRRIRTARELDAIWLVAISGGQIPAEVRSLADEVLVKPFAVDRLVKLIEHYESSDRRASP